MAHPTKCLFTVCRLYPSIRLNSRALSRFNREIVPQTSTTQQGQDFLLQNIKNAKSTTEVLDVLKNHYSIMNNRHVIQTLKSIFAMQKQGRSNMAMDQIIRNSNFENLCNQLKKSAPTMEPNEVIESLKVLNFLGVNSDSTIVQTLLQLIRHNVNQLTLPQIIFLDFLLYQMKSNNLTEALKIALPIVFEVNLPLKMNRDDIDHVAEYLHYVSTRNVPNASIELLVATIIKFQGEIKGDTAKSLIWSICELPPDTFFEPVIKRSIESIITDIDSFNFHDIESILSKLFSRHSTKYPFYYNELLCDLAGNCVVDRDLGFEVAAYMLKRFTYLGHAHNKLLDYISLQCVKNPALIASGDPLLVYSIVIAIALTDYRPVQWDILKEMLLKTVIFKNCTRRDIVYIRLAVSLSILDIYKPEVYERALNVQNLNNILRKNYIGDFENLLLISSSINHFKPELNYLLPPRSYIENIQLRVRSPTENPLDGALSKSLGGKEFIQTNYKSKLGLYIDHLINVKDGIPLPITQAEGGLSENVQRLGIIGLRPHHFVLNSHRKLRGTTLLLFKVLECENIRVVPICLEDWQNLPDREKIPYISRFLSEKYDGHLEVVDLTM